MITGSELLSWGFRKGKLHRARQGPFWGTTGSLGASCVSLSVPRLGPRFSLGRLLASLLVTVGAGISRHQRNIQTVHLLEVSLSTQTYRSRLVTQLTNALCLEALVVVFFFFNLVVSLF